MGINGLSSKRRKNKLHDTYIYKTYNSFEMKQSQFYYLLRRGLFGGGGIWAKYVNDFKARVVADGGTVESTTCINADVKYLTKNPA